MQGDALEVASVTAKACAVHTLAADSFDVIVVRCQYQVANEDSPLWADTLFTSIAPERCVPCFRRMHACWADSFSTRVTELWC